MIKILKWAYNRGREFERMRLKKITTELATQVAVEQQQFRQYPIKAEGGKDYEQGDRIEAAVNARVLQVLERLIYPQVKNQNYNPEMSPPLIDGDN